MYHRSLAKIFKQISKDFPVLLITGPRQVGKTTLLKMCAKNSNYVTLDDLEIRRFAKEDPGLFIQTYKPPLMIDEVQYAPQLFTYIKMEVDLRKKNNLFWLTGSQHYHLMKGITESLAGRIAILKLLGLSRLEKEGKKNYS